MQRTLAWVTTTLILLCVVGQLKAAYDPDEIGPGGPDNRLGLRTCVWYSSTRVRLTFGSSVNSGNVTRTSNYRLMSETDPNYKNGRFASSVTQTNVHDVSYPSGWGGGTYRRYTVTVTFPVAMQSGHKYYVQVLGRSSIPLTGGRSSMWVSQTAGDTTTNCLGIRRMELLTPRIMKITTGDGIDVTKVDALPGNFRLTSSDDPVYGTGGKLATSAWRRSRGDVFHTEGWPYKYFSQHEIYLVFDTSFVQGKTYSININGIAPVTCGVSNASIKVDDTANINPAIKVNQIGYLPNAPSKYAYIGEWMGSGGRMNIDWLMTSYSVRDADTHEVVMTGVPTLRRRHEWSLSPDGTLLGPSQAGEGYYRQDYTYEDVWQIDLSTLTTPGDYYVTVPRMGRSFRFTVADDVYAKPFDVAMIGLLHQRCGMPMTSDFSPFYRPTCHRNNTYLPGGSTKIDMPGGHHDAGDYNPRTHISLLEDMLLMYELAPGNFYDGQNRIPEVGNGIPDILDEAQYQLDLWIRLQNADGSIYRYVEANSDPNMITPGELDTIADYAWAATPGMTMRVAGSFATMADHYERLGFTQKAQDLTTRARNAFTWALANGGATSSNRDDAILGAIQMYRRTGETQYRNIFDQWSVYASSSNAELEIYQQYDQQLASFYYASCRRSVNSTIRTRILNAFNNRMAFWMQWAETTGYRYMPHAYAPNNWGTGAIPKWTMTPIQAYMLTGNQNYLRWVILTADFSLGCHPMNMVFTQRLGQRTISGPLHINSWATPDGPIPGMQSEGPSPRTGGQTATSSMSTWVGQALFPIGPWPQLQTYTDWRFIPEMNEGIVRDQATTAMVYGFLLNVPQPLTVPEIRGCHIFYNGSSFDGNNESANADDDNAIATDKQPLRPGGTASIENYTSYVYGINGVMVDIARAPSTPILSDFTFKVGNNSNPATWQTAPAPSSFVIRSGAGFHGSDRITFIWPNNTIEKQWLQITVRATSRTGLPADEIFYYGNAIGETGNNPGDARVDTSDEIGARQDPHKSFMNPAVITNRFDFNRDGKVDTMDELFARINSTNFMTELKLITVP